MPETISISTPLKDEILKNLKAGDRVLISGVIYSARDAAHKRLVELISRHRSGSANQIIDLLLEEIKRYIGEAEQHDDMTVVVVKAL